jgi:hypothetical protein
MKKKIVVTVLIALIAAVLISCTGSKGPAGPAGSQIGTVQFQDNVFPNSSYSGESDTTIMSAYPANKYYGNVETISGFWGGNNIERSLLTFDLTNTLPYGAAVKDAYLTICVQTIDGNGTNVEVHALTSSWTPSNTTWNSRNTATAWLAPGGDFQAAISGGPIAVTTAPSSAVYYTFALPPALVQGWINTPSSNYGLMIKATDETYNGNIVIYSGLNGISTNYGPKLTVYYTEN